VQYLNGVLSITVTDTVTATSFSTNVVLDLPGLLGTNTAYVGFTGATGGFAALQQVFYFFFTPIKSLNAQLSGNSLALKMPDSSGGYVLQQSPSLYPPAWSDSSNIVTQLNGVNTVTVPLSGQSQYFRLKLPSVQ